MIPKLLQYFSVAVIVCGIATPINCQGNIPISKADSLNNLVKSDKDDTNKVIHLNYLGLEVMYQNPDTAIILSKQALALAIQIASGSAAANDPAIKQAAQKGISQSNNNLGSYYYLKSDYPLALEYHFKALEVREATQDKDGIAKSCNNIGLVYRFQGDHAKALEYYFKALKLNAELGNKNRIASNLNNIGLVYFDQGDYTKALDNYFIALKFHKELGNENSVASTLNNIGIVYHAKKDYPKAIENYLKALKVNEEIDNKNEMANNLGNIGATYYDDHNYPMALEYHLKALVINEALGNMYGIAANVGNIGQVYVKENNHKEAEIFLLKALKISEEIGALEYIKENNKALSDLYGQTNQYQLAYEHYRKYSMAKDSLFNDDKSKEIGRLEMQHEIEKVERDRKLAEEGRLTTAKKNKQRKDTLQYSGIIVLLLIIGLLVGVLGFVKVKPAVASGVTFFAFLLFFEFLLVLLDPTVDKLSGGEPAYSLLFNACIAVCIFPIHAFFERVLKKRLTK